MNTYLLISVGSLDHEPLDPYIFSIQSRRNCTPLPFFFLFFEFLMSFSFLFNRVNLSALPSDCSVYTLARAWAQNDPQGQFSNPDESISVGNTENSLQSS